MKQTIDKNEFCQAFLDCGRGEQFSRAALEVLFDYLEEIDPEIEFDPIAICCEWCEYSTAIEAAEDYGKLFGDEVEAAEWLEQRTPTLESEEGTIVIANF